MKGQSDAFKHMKSWIRFILEVIRFNHSI